jgi:acyl carrier protein
MRDLNRLYFLLGKQFPNIVLPEISKNLMLGDFSEWDSLAHFDFLLLVEQDFNIRFSVDEMTEIKSFSDILGALEDKKK